MWRSVKCRWFPRNNIFSKPPGLRTWLWIKSYHVRLQELYRRTWLWQIKRQSWLSEEKSRSQHKHCRSSSFKTLNEREIVQKSRVRRQKLLSSRRRFHMCSLILRLSWMKCRRLLKCVPHASIASLEWKFTRNSSSKNTFGTGRVCITETCRWQTLRDFLHFRSLKSPLECLIC